MKMVIVLAAAVSFLLIAPIVYMYLDNVPPYEYDAGKSYIVPSRAHVEHQVTIHWAITKINRICRGYVVRFIIDADTGVKTTYDATPAATSVERGDTELDRTFTLPPNVAPGVKIYRSEGFYSCNPLQQLWPLRVVTPDIRFEVVQ